jgi:Fur family iron response transcriptional regulator
MNVAVTEMLRQRGAQPTAQRVALAEILFAKPQHLSADELLERARRKGVRVSKATVYNTLNLFVDCGLVREVSVDSSRVYYDPTMTPHHHIYNVDTGELTDIPYDAVQLAELPELPPGTETAGVEVVVKVRRRPAD